MNTRIRRLRPTKKAFDEVGAKKLLKSIAIQMDDIAVRSCELQQDREELLALLQKADDASVSVQTSVGTAYAEITRSAGKAQNLIDPKALQKKLDPADFFQCISVSVTKAKEFIGENELKRITTTIPGKTGAPTLKVTVK